MDALLASAVDDDWSRVIVEGWTLQELVAHLAAKDGLVAASVGAPVLGPPIEAADSLGRTHDVQAYERARSPEQTRRDWRAQADALCRHLAELPPATPPPRSTAWRSRSGTTSWPGAWRRGSTRPTQRGRRGCACPTPSPSTSIRRPTCARACCRGRCCCRGWTAPAARCC
ncbi:maleylpyruvate isomerase N-terminal domain-containing protein [Nonomuraea salmonea]|uniref:maleylpyruvate isomerase N-terminal domain-containing protein n=1 Tax=Nonomuraea salmonea TaxID=46181 RepID=UPI003CD07105